jgi:hypothetical protein
VPHIDYFRISKVGTIRKVLQGLMNVNTEILPMLYRDLADRCPERTDAAAFDRAISHSSFDTTLLARTKMRIADCSPMDIWETVVFNQARKKSSRSMFSSLGIA